MDIFNLYAKLGLEHILDLKGYDHILFVIALCLSFSHWKKILFLTTAFTVGHSITLALSSMGQVIIASKWVEFLIPVTIIISAASNIVKLPQQSLERVKPFEYLVTLAFGLIHGLGFSNYLKSLLGTSSNIIKQLLSFNIGLEIGQLVIVAVWIFISGTLYGFGLSKKNLVFAISCLVIGLASNMAVERFMAL